MSAGYGQTGEKPSYNGIFQIEDEHVDQVNAVADFPEELQHRPVYHRFPAGGSHQKRESHSSRKEKIQRCFPPRIPQLCLS